MWGIESQVRCLAKSKNELSDKKSKWNWSLLREAVPGKGASRVAGTGQCPELPFHVTVGSSLVSNLLKV